MIASRLHRLRSPLQGIGKHDGQVQALLVQSAAILGLNGTLKPLGVVVRESQFASGFSLPQPKSLDAIMKLEKIQAVPADKVTTMWNDYHVGRGHISAVMSASLFKLFEYRAMTCPLFVVPVKKARGFVNMVVQAQMPHLLFTGLEDYKVRGTEASPYLAVTHYSELAETKKLVLVRGDVVLPGKLSDEEAQALLQETHAFYLQERRFALVRAFNKDPSSFEFRSVLQEMGISY